MSNGPFGSAHLTTFTGADETPLSEGGTWTQTFTERDPLRRKDNNATDSVHGLPNYSHYIGGAAPYLLSTSSKAELFACTGGGQLGAALETWRVAWWTQVGDVSPQGYLGYYGGALSKDFVIRRYDGGAFDDFDTIADSGGGYPSKMALCFDKDMVQLWATFFPTVDTWQLMTEVSDTTYRGRMHPGLGIEDPTAGGLGFFCFGVEILNRQQFFRLLFN